LEELERDFNLLPKENLEGLDSNVAALINALIETNLGVNYIKRELNHIKLIEFRRIEVKDPNK